MGRKFHNCNEPNEFGAADELLELIAAAPAGMDRRELQRAFRQVCDAHHYTSDTTGMRLLHLLEYSGKVVVHRDSPRVIRLARAREES